MGAAPASERGADEEMGLEFDYDSQPIEYTHIWVKICRAGILAVFLSLSFESRVSV